MLIDRGWISEGKGRWHHPGFDDDEIQTYETAWFNRDNATVQPTANPRTGMWRVGRKLGRTLYCDDELVGLIDNPRIAASIVAGLNADVERMADGKCDEHIALGTAIALCAAELDEIAPGSEAGDLRRAFNQGVQACIEAFRQYGPRTPHPTIQEKK